MDFILQHYWNLGFFMIMCPSTKGQENFQSKGKRGTSMTVLWYPHLSEEDFLSTVTLAFSKESMYSSVIFWNGFGFLSGLHGFISSHSLNGPKGFSGWFRTAFGFLNRLQGFFKWFLSAKLTLSTKKNLEQKLNYIKSCKFQSKRLWQTDNYS